MIKEEDIYDLITNSAKTRFNYNLLEELFSTLNETFQPSSENDIAEKVLWLILMYLSMGETPEQIAFRIQNEIILTGFFVEDISPLSKIIAENTDKWKKETGALKMATEMLNANFASVDQVHEFVSKMLSE